MGITKLDVKAKAKPQECPRKGCQNPALIHPIYGVLPCKECQIKDSRHHSPKVGTSDGIFKLHRKQKQRDNHGKDLIQPFSGGKPNPDFAKNYPELAPDYYKESELKKI